jgi:hypothetical protein
MVKANRQCQPWRAASHRIVELKDCRRKAVEIQALQMRVLVCGGVQAREQLCHADVRSRA